MSKTTKPLYPSEVPEPNEEPEISPATFPEGPAPGAEPEFVPEKEPKEPSPGEIPLQP